MSRRSPTAACARVEQCIPNVDEGNLATLRTQNTLYLPSLRLHGGLQKWGAPRKTPAYLYLYYRDSPKVSSSFLKTLVRVVQGFLQPSSILGGVGFRVPIWPSPESTL